MSIYFIDSATYLVMWEFDVELAERATTTIEWTNAPVETGADITRFGVERPDKFRVEGRVTATPWDTGYDPQRVMDADQALRDIARKRQPLTMIAGNWVEEVVISVVEGGTAAGEGEGLNIAIDCQTVKRTTPTVTKIPASRLKAKVKKQAAAAKKGGAAAGSAGNTATNGKAKTLTLRVVQAMGLF